MISSVESSEVLRCEDKLIFSCDVSDLGHLQGIEGLRLFALRDEKLDLNLTEVVIAPS
ncbi:hypothetical protein [uncultured Microbulbifer sp.]|uniref:hypothetical protein n=1 Tax=uncultured Microbulbifer sp. TaxID=348147 RepID=UPI00262519CA|nr:hypothetical protein [uncultured Microbulbifer sp.]